MFIKETAEVSSRLLLSKEVPLWLFFCACQVLSGHVKEVDDAGQFARHVFFQVLVEHNMDGSVEAKPRRVHGEPLFGVTTGKRGKFIWKNETT